MRIRLAVLLGALVLSGSTPGLAQDRVEAAYRAALAVSPTPRSLQEDQRWWREDRARMDAPERAHMDQDRVEDLNALRDRDASTARTRPTLAGLLAGCVPLGLDGCSAEGGWLRVTDDRVLFWQTQRGTTEEDGITGAAILMSGRADGSLTPVAWVRGGFFSAPVVVMGENGAVYVALPGFHAGTGHHNAVVVFRWTGDAARPLVQIDNTSWTDALKAQLPEGLEVWKGVDIDYENLVAFTPLWQAGDGNCCPSGGTAILNFRLEADRLALDSVSPKDNILEVAMTVPADVLDFIARTGACEHWGGEEPYDADRRARIEAAVAGNRCDALPTDAAALRAKYADSPANLALISRMTRD